MNQFRAYYPKMKEKSLPASSAHPQEISRSRAQPSFFPAPNTQRRDQQPPRALLQPSQTDYTKASQRESNFFTSFIKELPANHSFSDLIIKSVLNYRTRWYESQCSTSRTNKHAKIKCSGLLPEGGCQRQHEQLSFTELGVPWKTSDLARRRFSKPPFTKHLHNK